MGICNIGPAAARGWGDGAGARGWGDGAGARGWGESLDSDEVRNDDGLAARPDGPPSRAHSKVRETQEDGDSLYDVVE